jgi:hypothetical protein
VCGVVLSCGDVLQEALAQDIVQAADLMHLFQQAVMDTRGGETPPAHPLLTLKEFYTFAVKLQVFVDEKCGAW